MSIAERMRKQAAQGLAERMRKQAAQGLAADMRRAKENMAEMDAPRQRPRSKLKLVSAPAPSMSMERAMLSRMEDLRPPEKPKAGLIKRIKSAVYRWWHRIGKDDTHRFKNMAYIKVFNEVPKRIDDLYSEDESGRPYDKVKFKEVWMDTDDTCEYVDTFSVGIVLVKLHDGRYGVVGLDDIETI